MRVRINEIGSILDDQIIKSAFKTRETSVSDFENKINKSITFNPFEPKQVESSENTPYYVPYGESVDGGFYPHPVGHWADQGKNPDDYRDVHDFYSKIGAAQESMAALRAVHGQGSRFSFLKRSIDCNEEEVYKSEDLYIDVENIKYFVKSDFVKSFIGDVIFQKFFIDLPEMEDFFIQAN